MSDTLFISDLIGCLMPDILITFHWNSKSGNFSMLLLLTIIDLPKTNFLPSQVSALTAYY